MREFRVSNQPSITDRSNASFASYLSEIAHSKPLTPDEEAELAAVVRRGGEGAEEARNKLVNANLSFVISVAKEYKSSVLEMTDLVEEGNMGLLRAAQSFDGTKGFKFITYAVWWIRQSILAALHSTDTALRLPQNQQTVLRQYHKMQEDVYAREHRSLSIDEFCDISGVERERMCSVLDGATHMVKMDDHLGDDTDTTVGDMMTSDSVTDSELEHESMRTDIVSVLHNILTEREFYVVSRYYGITCDAISLEEISLYLNLSRERTRQIRMSALTKVRNSPFASRLQEHLAA